MHVDVGAAWGMQRLVVGIIANAICESACERCVMNGNVYFVQPQTVSGSRKHTIATFFKPIAVPTDSLLEELPNGESSSSVPVPRDPAISTPQTDPPAVLEELRGNPSSSSQVPVVRSTTQAKKELPRMGINALGVVSQKFEGTRIQGTVVACDKKGNFLVADPVSFCGTHQSQASCHANEYATGVGDVGDLLPGISQQGTLARLGSLAREAALHQRGGHANSCVIQDFHEADSGVSFSRQFHRSTGWRSLDAAVSTRLKNLKTK
jgi:hypothetical protein